MNTVNPHETSGTLNAFLENHIDNHAVVAGFNTMISKLRCYGTVPSRVSLIALGIHFGMSGDDISTMLSLAGMEPLCAKDKLESIVIFAVEYITIRNPGIEFSNALLLKQYTQNPEMKAKCEILLNQFEMTDYHFEHDTDLFEYITDTLFNIDSDITDELLYLLGKSQ